MRMGAERTKGVRTAGKYQHRSGKVVNHRQGAQRQQFTYSDGLLRLFAREENPEIETPWLEKEILLRADIFVRQISIDVRDARKRCYQAGRVIREAVRVDKVLNGWTRRAGTRCLLKHGYEGAEVSGGGVPEAEGLVEIRLDEVCTGGKEGEEGSVH